MEVSWAEVLAALKEKNIRLSHQRLKVLAYLCQHLCHPTVDQIYQALRREVPTLSRTTVYNTLEILVEAGLVRVVTIEDTQARYDINTHEHGHFKCNSCGFVYDFAVEIGALPTQGLEGARVDAKDVYFRGTCSKCLAE